MALYLVLSMVLTVFLSRGGSAASLANFFPCIFIILYIYKQLNNHKDRKKFRKLRDTSKLLYPFIAMFKLLNYVENSFEKGTEKTRCYIQPVFGVIFILSLVIYLLEVWCPI